MRCDAMMNVNVMDGMACESESTAKQHESNLPRRGLCVTGRIEDDEMMENFSSEEDGSSKDAKVVWWRWWFRRWERKIWEVDSMVCAGTRSQRERRSRGGYRDKSSKCPDWALAPTGQLHVITSPPWEQLPQCGPRRSLNVKLLPTYHDCAFTYHI